MKILMVCLGNICRSPLAEGILKEKCKKKNLNWIIDSAGTVGCHVGIAPYDLSQQIALHNNIDISKQQCRKFIASDIESFNLIFVMDSSNYADVRKICGSKWNEKKVKFILNEVYPNQNKNLPDPWNGTEKDFEYVFDLLDKACDAIIAHYS